MNKVIKNIVLLLIFFFILNINVYAKEDVEISSVTCNNMTIGEESNLGVQVNGLNLKIEDAYFSRENDYLECSLEIKNNLNDDVLVKYDGIEQKSNENLKYTITTNNGDSIKPKSTKEYKLRVDYKKEYTEDKVINNNLEFNFDGNTKNPKTSSTVEIILILASLIILLSLVLLEIKRKDIKRPIGFIFIMGLVLAIPTVYALTIATIKVDSKIIVEKKYHVYYVYDGYLPESDTLGKEYVYKYRHDYSEEYTYNDGQKTIEYKWYEIIVKVMGTYKPGEKVTLDKNKVFICEDWDDNYYCIKTNYVYDDDWDSDYLSYITDFSDFYEYNTLSEYFDLTKVNKTPVDNLKLAYGYTEGCPMNEYDFKVPNKFTMPEHDIIITEKISCPN